MGHMLQNWYYQKKVNECGRLKQRICKNWKQFFQRDTIYDYEMTEQESVPDVEIIPKE